MFRKRQEEHVPVHKVPEVVLQPHELRVVELVVVGEADHEEQGVDGGQLLVMPDHLAELSGHLGD